MKKFSKITVGVFIVLFISIFEINIVKADTLTGLGNDSKDASIMAIYDPDIYSIDIEWGSMRYTYYKEGTNNYQWHPYTDGGYKSSNYVEVTNNSTNAITAALSWESSITGVSASFHHVDRTLGNGTCTSAEGLIASTPEVWSDNGTLGVNRTSSNPEELIYTDNTCQTYVTAGTVYDSSVTYYRVSPTYSQIVNSASATIPVPVLSQNANFTVVGAYNQQQNMSLPTTTNFGIDLSGGSVNDVKTAYNTTAKKIGTVTLTITDAE